MSENITNSQPAEYSSNYRFVISFTAFFSQIALTLCLACLSPLGPYIREALNMNYTQFGLLFTHANAGTMVFLWITGPLVDRIGVRKVLLAGCILMACGFFVASNLNTAMQLIILELGLGICNSAAGPTGSKMVSTWFGPSERGTHMSIKQAGIPMGSTLAGLILPVICTTSGWRATYRFLSAFLLIVGIISAILYKDSSVMKESLGKNAHKSSFSENAPLIFKKNFILLSCGCLLLMGAQFALSGNMSNYCSSIFADLGVENPSIVSGRIYSYACIAGIVGRVVFGIIADKSSAKRTLMGINIAAAVVLVVLGFTGDGLTVVTMTLIMIVYGFLGFAWSGLQLGIASSMTPVKATATTISITLSFSFAGMMIFSPVFGAVVDACGFSVGWFFLAVVTVIGVLFLIPMKEVSAK